MQHVYAPKSALRRPGAAGMAAPSRFTWKATRIAAKLHPPALLVEYRPCAAAAAGGAYALEPASPSGSRVRTFELTNLRPDTDVPGLAKQVLRGLPRALDPATISSAKVQQILARLVTAAAAAPPAFTTAAAAPAHAITPPGSPSYPFSSPFHPITGSPEEGPLAADDSAVSVSSASSASATPTGTDVSAASSRVPSARGPLAAHTDAAAVAAATAVTAVPKLSFASLPRPEPADSPPLRTRNRSSPDPVAPASHLPEPAVAAAANPGAIEAAALAAADISMYGQQGGDSHPQQHQLHPPAATAAAAVPPRPSVAAAAGASAAAGVAQARVSSTTASEVDEEECLVMEMSIGGEVDLNTVTEYELQLAKDRMENVFAANVVKPGDPGYVYDKQVEFTTPTQANEWDDEEDEE